MTKSQAGHLGTGLAFAAAAALAVAVAVVWFPSLPGRAGAGAFIAFWLSVQLGRHRHARRGLEALGLGAVLAALLIIFAGPALPAAVFAVIAAGPARHYLDPRRARVARTTRGVRDRAAKAAGGRPGRPGEDIAPRRPRTSAAVPPRPPASAGRRWEPDGWRAPVVDEPRPRWPHAAPWKHADALPFAGEGDLAGPAAPPAPAPRRLRRDEGRPGPLHRSVCNDCLDHDCARCADRGCECPQGPHPARPGAPRVPAQREDSDRPPF